jgi:hypothetical protein
MKQHTELLPLQLLSCDNANVVSQEFLASTVVLNRALLQTIASNN